MRFSKMQRKILSKAVLAVLAGVSLATLSGCFAMNKEIKEEVDTRTDKSINQVEKIMDLTHAEAKEQSSQVDWSKIPVLSTKKLTLTRELPDLFHQEIEVNEIFPVGVRNLISTISQQAGGLFITVERDVTEELQSSSSSSGGQSSIISDSSGQPLGMPMDIAPANNDTSLTFSYTGTVKQTLDSLASKLDANWRYDYEANKVVIYRFIDKQFYIPSIPGESSINASVSDSLNNSERGAGFELKSNTWDQIDSSLKKIIDDKSGNYSISQATGHVLVRTTPQIMKRVESYIDSAKKSLRSQVLIDVQVLSVRQELDDNREMNLKNVLESGGWSVALAGGAETALTGASSIVVSPIKDQVANVLGSKYKLTTDSSSIFTLLNKIGVTTTIDEVPIRTINNQPAAASTTIQESYLSKSEITTDPTTGVQSSSLTTKDSKVGLSLNILPTLGENGRDLMLQVAFSLSDIPKYRTDETMDGSKTITPTINSRDFVQKTWLRSGQTLVMSGLSMIRAKKSSEGPVNSDNWFFGGAKNNGLVKEKIVVLVTPRVYNAVTDK